MNPIAWIRSAVGLVRDLKKPTPKELKPVRNTATAIAAASGALHVATLTSGNVGISPELIAALPEPWTTIISGACMVISGVVALLAQSKVESEKK